MRKYPWIGLRISVWILGLLPLFSYPGFASQTVSEPELKLALRIVHFQGEHSSHVLSAKEASRLIQEVNGFFTSCRVSFVLERLDSVNAALHGLPERPSSLEELDPIRARLKDSNRLLIVQTGAWRGTLASANAWTVLPGEGPLGTVMESTYARHARLIAHELAHALNLDHVTDRQNLLHPVLHPDSSALTQEQCTQMRSAALRFHSLALRDAESQASSARNLASTALQAQSELKFGNGIASGR